RFYTMVRTMARGMGIDVGHIFAEKDAQRAVDAYRNRYPQIPAGWRKLDFILETAWLGVAGVVGEFGPCLITEGAVTLPGGLQLRYSNPRRNPFSGEVDSGK